MSVLLKYIVIYLLENECYEKKNVFYKNYLMKKMQY